MVEPSIWGPCAWFFLHTITFAYPSCPTEEDKWNMKQFFESLQPVLPCKKCQLNFSKHFEKHPLTYDILCSKKELIKWLIDIHNDVNVMNGKPTMGYDEAINSILNKKKKDPYIPSIVMIIGVIVLLMVGGFFAWSAYKKKTSNK